MATQTPFPEYKLHRNGSHDTLVASQHHNKSTASLEPPKSDIDINMKTYRYKAAIKQPTRPLVKKDK